MSIYRLSDYKIRYKAAKKQETRTKLFNKAFLNLPVSEFAKFAKWHEAFINEIK